MDYAKQKLLNGPNELRNGNRTGSLACLSTRFALEFDMDGTARDVTHAQVERHMRLCIAATTGFEKMTAISGSEPLLAEAAYKLMKGSGMNAVRHLAGHADLNYIDRGRLDDALGQLRRYVEHDPGVLPFLGWDPRLQGLHGLPGFSAADRKS